MTKSLLIFNKIVWLKFKNVPQSTISRSFNLFLMISMVVIMQLKDYLHDRSQSQFFYQGEHVNYVLDWECC